MTSPLRHILFDLDNTLIDHSRASEQALAELYGAHSDLFGHVSYSAFAAAYEAINHELWGRYERGLTTIPDILDGRFRRLCDALDVAAHHADGVNRRYMTSYIDNARSEASSAELLESLRRDGFSLGIFSNGSADVQQAKIERAGIDDFFGPRFFAEDYPHCKPNRAYFDHILAELSAPPREIMVVGDSLANDIVPTVALGFHAVWLDRDGRGADAAGAAGCDVIARLDELADVVATRVERAR